MIEAENTGAANAPTGSVHIDGQIAAALGDPLLADWRNVKAVQVRQDQLVAMAHVAEDAMVGPWLNRGACAERQDAAMRAFAANMVALDDAMRSYTWQTQRGDVMEVVRGAIETSAGEAAAEALTGVLARVRET